MLNNYQPTIGAMHITFHITCLITFHMISYITFQNHANSSQMPIVRSQPYGAILYPIYSKVHFAARQMRTVTLTPTATTTPI